ncbi:hypothetical protein PF005_g18489 [Phytophthora fragariae]|uniref:RxLR effector protein n=1 Tax=Phytophthora fragariae TaxID=53985 RepID=A0A6A3RLJ2_9STRA|nr:hypothetical protein PF003_g27378 [Phytophthora fragariae]KAE8925229.1 hypothetical protein PF009_g24557 [Phytophthora fragariae]KAE8984065.1 hypothetical protein PF011_g20924 [Phytophthora fragariae]KAE9078475.1 hypothetical protein PF010_g23107 [Phytophthora fragariae]KAE9078577.1 hypothetical protein PF007_g23793 [Phytophthora fragariae]
MVAWALAAMAAASLTHGSVSTSICSCVLGIFVDEDVKLRNEKINKQNHRYST